MTCELWAGCSPSETWFQQNDTMVLMTPGGISMFVFSDTTLGPRYPAQERHPEWEDVRDS